MTEAPGVQRPSDVVLAYGEEVGRLMVRREMSGGGLSQEDEGTVAATLYDLLCQMTEAEQDVIASTVAQLTRRVFRCLYCKGGGQDARAQLPVEEAREHIASCDKHPVRAERDRADRAEAQLAQTRVELDAARIAMNGAIRAAVAGGAVVVETDEERVRRERFEVARGLLRRLVNDHARADALRDARFQLEVWSKAGA